MTNGQHIHGHGLKKPSIMRGEDAQYLGQLSKAALVDLLTEALRVNAGECDTPLTALQVQEHIATLLAARGDRMPKIQTNPRNRI
jgi:hypothetical protein